MIFEIRSLQALVAQAFNLSIREAEASGSLEFESNLVYKTSSRTASVVTQRDPVLKNKTQQTKKKMERVKKK